MVDIVPSAARYDRPIELLLDQAFGADRRQKTSYRFRENVGPVASLGRVALVNDVVVGSIQYWPVALGAEQALLLGPVATGPAWTGVGIGSCLILSSLTAAKTEGWAHVFLVGDPRYYRRFGFRPASEWGVTMADEEQWRLQGKMLGPAPPPAGELMPLTK